MLAVFLMNKGTTTQSIIEEEDKNYCGDNIIQQPNDYGQFEECDDGYNSITCDNWCRLK